MNENNFDDSLSETGDKTQGDWIKSEKEREEEYWRERERATKAKGEQSKQLEALRKPWDKWYRLAVFWCFLPLGFCSGIAYMVGGLMLPAGKKDSVFWPLWLESVQAIFFGCVFGIVVFTFVYYFVDWRFRKLVAKRFL